MNRSMRRSSINNNVWYKSMLVDNPVYTDYELIATTFGNGVSTAINFTSIPQDYKHLQLRFVTKSIDGSISGNLRFNGSTSTTIYAVHWLEGNGSSVVTNNATAQPSAFLRQVSVTSSVANSFSAGVIDFIDYSSTNKNTVFRAFYGASGSTGIFMSTGLYMSTAALDRIQFSGQSAFNSASRFSLYGIRG